MAAEPLKTISFLPHPSKRKATANWLGVFNHRRHKQWKGYGRNRMQISCCCDQSLRFDFFGRSKVPPVRRGGWTNGRRARTGGEASTPENPEDGYKEDQSTSQLSPTMTSFFPVPARSVKGSLFPNSVPSAFSVASKVGERMLTVCAEFQRERVEPPFLGRVS